MVHLRGSLGKKAVHHRVGEDSSRGVIGQKGEQAGRRGFTVGEKTNEETTGEKVVDVLDGVTALAKWSDVELCTARRASAFEVVA